MLVTEFKEKYSDVINENTLELIMETCPCCHSELELSLELTRLSCPNPFCLNKTVQRVLSMFQTLGVKNLGESRIRELFYALNLTYGSSVLTLDESDFDLMLIDEYQGTSTAESLNRIYNSMLAQLDEHREMTLIQYIKLLNLPDLQKRADLIFKDIVNIHDLEKFYQLLEWNGAYEIQKRLGVGGQMGTLDDEYGETTSILAMKLFETLITYEVEILDSLDLGIRFGRIKLIEPKKADVSIKLVCSDQVGAPFSTKRDLYQYVEKQYGNKVAITWDSTVTKGIHALIWQGADGTPARHTNKVAKVEKWDEQGHHIPIITANQLIDMLDRSSNGQVFLDTLESI